MISIEALKQISIEKCDNPFEKRFPYRSDKAKSADAERRICG
jgi:hypothetical protein